MRLFLWFSNTVSEYIVRKYRHAEYASFAINCFFFLCYQIRLVSSMQKHLLEILNAPTQHFEWFFMPIFSCRSMRHCINQSFFMDHLSRLSTFIALLLVQLHLFFTAQCKQKKMEELVYVKTKLMNSTNEATSLVILVTLKKTGNLQEDVYSSQQLSSYKNSLRLDRWF